MDNASDGAHHNTWMHIRHLTFICLPSFRSKSFTHKGYDFSSLYLYYKGERIKVQRPKRTSRKARSGDYIKASSPDDASLALLPSSSPCASCALWVSHSFLRNSYYFCLFLWTFKDYRSKACCSYWTRCIGLRCPIVLGIKRGSWSYLPSFY